MNISELSIRRPIFISCIVALMLILGFVNLKKMPVDLFPDVTFPVIFIQVTYPGAPPVDMEKLVAKPIEDELGGLAGLKNITSNNFDSVAFVVLEFRLGTDVKDAEQQVRNRLGNIRRLLPKDMEEPIVRRFDPAEQPVISFALKSKMGSGDIYDIANEMIKPQFEKLPNVGQVSLVGGRKKEIHVIVDQKKLKERHIPMIQLIRRIEEASKDIPIGKIESQEKEIVFRTHGEIESLDDLKKIAINFVGSDRAVKLGEVARIEVGLEDEKRIASVKGENALILNVFKQSGANTVSVADSVKNQIEKVNIFLKEKKIAAEVEMVRDLSRPIRLNIVDVRESILLGIFLCIVVVFFFLGSARSTFITGMALPNSLLGGFIFMSMMGFTINMMTLLALSLAVGLLIDDAIVVRENIFRHLELGQKPIDAALNGTKEVALAVIATTLVVIAVFGPIAFLEGVIGQFFKQFGLTIVFMMLISLFDAFTVAPMLSAYMATGKEHVRGRGWLDRLVTRFDEFQNFLEALYVRALVYTLTHRLKILISAGVVFILSLGVSVYVPKTFLPANDNGEFMITAELSVGTSLSATENFTRKIEEIISQDPSVELWQTTIGSTNLESNKSEIFIRLVERKNRSLTTSKAKEIYREKMKVFSEQAIVAISDVDIANSGQKPLNLNLSSDNLETLTEYANRLKMRISKIPGLVDVDINYRSGKPEYHIQFDRTQTESLGVSTVTAGAELRSYVEGAIPAVYRDKGIEYNIRVRMDEKFRDLRGQMEQILVPNSNFNMIPLSHIAKGKEIQSYSQVNRQNKNRFISISGNIGLGGALGTITQEIEKILKVELPPPAGVDYRFLGQAEDFKDLMANMLLAMFLGVVFIYLVLASLYESFLTPFTILLALPMAVTGALLALYVTGKSIDIFSLIGIVMLLGVVAKNSILLVDYSLQLVEQGMAQNEAIIKACKTRLRPILMTSFALIAGTIPIAIGLNEVSAMRTSMGVAIIGGLISSTFLSLIVVPAAFGYVENFKLWIRKIWSS